MVPTIGVKSLSCFLLIPKVSHENISATHTKLSGSRANLSCAGSTFVQSGMEAFQVFANRARFQLAIAVPSLGSGYLAHPIDFQNLDIEGHEVVKDVSTDGGGSTEEAVSVTETKLLLHLAEDHLVCNLEGKLCPIAASQLCLVILKTRLLCPASKSLLETSVCLPNLNHLLLDLLPHPGHPKEHSGQGLLQGGHQGPLQGVPVGKVDGAEALGGHEEVHDVCRHVGERKVRDESLLQVQQAIVVAESFCCECEIVMTEHHTLGGTRCSRSVNQVTAEVWSHSLQPCFQLLLLLLLSNLQKLLPGENPLSGWCSSVLDYMPQFRKTLTNLQYLGKLLLILDNDQIGSAVGKHILARLCRVGWIDTGSKASSKHAPNVCKEPLR